MTKKKQRAQAMANQEELPSQAQIAELHALLKESKDLAYEINYPISGILFSSLIKIPSYLILHDRTLVLITAFFYDWLGLSKNSSIPVLSLLAIAPAIFYLYQQVFAAISSTLVNIFPKGFTFDRSNHPAYEMANKLGTKRELNDIIISLKALIREQKASANRTFYGALLSSMAIPFLASFSVNPGQIIYRGGSFKLNFNLLGPRILYVGPTSNVIPKFIESLAGDQQGLRFYSAIKTFWSNFNSPKQLRNYVKKLEQLSCLTKPYWKYDPKDKKDKALFYLSAEDEDITFLDKGNDRHTVSSSLYIKELYRIFIEEGISIYAPGKKAIYVGYSSLSEQRTSEIKERLLSRLIFINEQKAQSEAFVKKLNTFTKVISSDVAKWRFYTEFDNNEQLRTYYYLSTTDFAPDLFLIFLKNLETIIPDPQKNISTDEDIIKICSVPIDLLNEQQLKTATKNLQVEKANLKNEISSGDASQSERTLELMASTLSLLPRRTRKNLPSERTAIPQLPQTATKISPYPESIFFKKYGVKRVVVEDIENLEEEAVFPLHIPWLPEGRAYGAIDKRVYSAVSEFLEPKAILNVLKQGSVHGTKAASKSKVGAVGIQVTNQPYQDVEGISHQHSDFKLKFSNNIRIFGRKVEVVKTADEDRVLYIFDGPAYGH